MKNNYLSILGGLALAVTTLWQSPAYADDAYPSRPVKIIMPVPAGSGLDVIARLVGEEMAVSLRQPVVIENKPGAGGAIAADAVIAAPRDGYTILGGAASVFTILPAGKEKLNFDVNRDFVQVGLVNRSAMVLAVGKDSKIQSFSDFIDAARAQPDSLSVGMTGAGTLPHFVGLVLVKKGQIPLTLVPYTKGGTAEAIKDILGGRVTAVIDSLSGLKGAIDGGQLKPIATMAPEREASLQDVQTVGETLSGFHAAGFMTLAVPAGTSSEIVTRLNGALQASLDDETVKARFAQLGIVPKALSPAETQAFVEGEENVWWPLVKELGSN